MYKIKPRFCSVSTCTRSVVMHLCILVWYLSHELFKCASYFLPATVISKLIIFHSGSSDETRDLVTKLIYYSALPKFLLYSSSPLNSAKITFITLPSKLFHLPAHETHSMQDCDNIFQLTAVGNISLFIIDEA